MLTDQYLPLALHTALGVPQRFAVADQDKLGHETVKSW